MMRLLGCRTPAPAMPCPGGMIIPDSRSYADRESPKWALRMALLDESVHGTSGEPAMTGPIMELGKAMTLQPSQLSSSVLPPTEGVELDACGRCPRWPAIGCRATKVAAPSPAVMKSPFVSRACDELHGSSGLRNRCAFRSVDTRRPSGRYEASAVYISFTCTSHIHLLEVSPRCEHTHPSPC